MTFLFDMSMRLFVGARYTPRLVIGSLILRRQRPEWVGEQQKLTWTIGLVLAFVSCTAMGFLGVSAEIQLALCSVGLGVLFIESPDVAAATIATMPSKAPPTADTPEPEAVAPYDTTTALVFLMEEKRLAHDVYVTLGEEWGTGIFANIAGSETTHLSPSRRSSAIAASTIRARRRSAYSPIRTRSPCMTSRSRAARRASTKPSRSAS